MSGEQKGLEMFFDPDELQHFNTLLMFRTWTSKTAGVDDELATMLKVARGRERHERREMVRLLKLRP